MVTKRTLPPEPAIEDAILRMIVEKFDGQPLDWQTSEWALSLASFEIKYAALKGRRKPPARWGP